MCSYLHLEFLFLIIYFSDILKEGTQTTFSLNFFLHGDSNVCANVNVHQHCAVRTITKEDVLLAQQMPEGLPGWFILKFKFLI